jgi:Phosphoinositide phospholipase C, Ca2+-dependent
VLGTHNSYHVQPAPPLLDAIRAVDPDLAGTLEYSHRPLDEQLDAGIRQIELDVFADPGGGLYADPAGPAAVGIPGPPVAPLEEQGFKVFHVQDVDQGSTCPTLVRCLRILRDWSADHPEHVPVLVLVEVKDDPIPDPGLGFVVPLPVGPGELDDLDAEIRSVFPEDWLVTPDLVRGEAPTLEEAVLARGWPELGEIRGRVVFALDNEDGHRDDYVAGHPSLAGRVLFTSSPPGTPEAAFVKRNDPVADGAEIRTLVGDGYLVRTRADADTVQARSGDTTQRDAAFASGAQYVSTDYPEDDPAFPAEYAAVLPGGGPGRCNPVTAPPGCAADDVEPR